MGCLGSGRGPGGPSLSRSPLGVLLMVPSEPVLLRFWLKSSKGKSPGGSKPDLKDSTTMPESWGEAGGGQRRSWRLLGTFIISTSALHLFSPAYLSVIDGFGSGNHAVQTLGHDGNDSSLGLGEAPVRLPELHRPTLIHVLQILRHISDKRFLSNLATWQDSVSSTASADAFIYLFFNTIEESTIRQLRQCAIPWRCVGWRCWNASTAQRWSFAAGRRTRSCTRRPGASASKSCVWPERNSTQRRQRRLNWASTPLVPMHCFNTRWAHNSSCTTNLYFPQILKVVYTSRVSHKNKVLYFHFFLFWKVDVLFSRLFSVITQRVRGWRGTGLMYNLMTVSGTQTTFSKLNTNYDNVSLFYLIFYF